MKVKYFGLATLLGMLALTSSVNAETIDDHKPAEIDIDKMNDEIFSDLKDTDLVLEMPEGGFLYGQATEYSADNMNKVIAKYDSETDPNSVTVAEAKEILKKDYLSAREDDTNIVPYGAAPPASNRVRELEYGKKYYSAYFTGKGWRFSDVQWKAAPGTGDYLEWSSLVDSGRVGSYGEAYATYKDGLLLGTVINEGTYVWNSEGGQGQVYFTFNPISGTQYYVENVDAK